jgi:amino acid adenylation domain-containing protein
VITHVASGTLATGFLRSVERVPDRPAVSSAGIEVSYEELHRRALAVAHALLGDEEEGPPLTAVLGARGVSTFAAILGALLRGHGYVPLSPRYPPGRNRELLERSGCRAIVVDDANLPTARELVATMRFAPRVVASDPAAKARPQDEITPRASTASTAYLLFTSGSTGRPKGVPVAHGNVRAFLDAITQRYELRESDRFSQMFDLTFDLSIFDLFAAWEVGACVCCPDEKRRLEPSTFIRDAGVTVWFSVPSVAMLMQRFGTLEPGSFEELRLSLFCGEGLPDEVAAAWASSAPNSIVENLYGPTEATIACTAHRWAPEEERAPNGLVPIGRPFGETETAVVDESLRPVPPGKAGELLLRGPQVVAGYLSDEQATAAAFVDHEPFGRAYRTGDRVVEPAPGEPLQFLGRMDSQIKVLGHRVELGEVEAALREASGATAVAVGWPRTASGAAGLVAFLANESLDPVELRKALAQRLPDYMIPREIRLLADLPLNANGKHDRQALVAQLEAE